MPRPKKQIDKEQFEKLCSLQCTEAEICGFFDVTDKTLVRWCKETYDGKGFSEIYKTKRGVGLISLRRWQWKLAEKNTAMAIFLGKQYLGQSDYVINDTMVSADDGFLKALNGTAAADWNDDSADV